MSQSTLLATDLILAAMALAIALFGAVTVATSKLTQGRAAGLVIFLVIAASDSVDELLSSLGVYGALPGLLGWAWPWPTLYGPALYLYVRAMTSARPVLMTGRQWLLFVAPALAALVLATPFYLQPAPLKLALTSGQLDVLSSAPAILRWGLNGLYVLFFSISLIYLVVIFRQLSQHLHRVRDLFSNIEDRSLSWLRWVLLATCGAWVWAGVLWWLTETEGPPLWLDPMRLILHLAWVSCFAAFGAAQGPALASDSCPEAGVAAPDTDPRAGGVAPAGGRYARSGLTEKRMSRIATRLEQAMVERQLYRDPGMSLRRLSSEIGVSENYVSQTLNVQIGKNFFDFVNAHRVEAAKHQLTNGNDTTLAVALDVGFNSRSTFNAAFSKHAGTTPSAYRTLARVGEAESKTS